MWLPGPKPAPVAIQRDSSTTVGASAGFPNRFTGKNSIQIAREIYTCVQILVVILYAQEIVYSLHAYSCYSVYLESRQQHPLTCLRDHTASRVLDCHSTYMYMYTFVRTQQVTHPQMNVSITFCITCPSNCIHSLG